MSPSDKLLGVTYSRRPCTQLIGAALLSLSACAADASPTLVGSKQVKETEVAVMVVESALVSVPFHVRVFDGEPNKISIRGEDNLIAQIEAKETTASHWRISAPWDLKFEQHEPVDISIPFLNMVEIQYDGDVQRPDGNTPDAK